MPKHEPAYFDSQGSAAAALKIDIYELRAAKSSGCKAFRSGRVYRDELLDWFEEKRRRSAGPNDEKNERQRLAANTILKLLECQAADLLTADQCFDTGTTIVEAAKDELLLRMWIELNFEFVCRNYPELPEAHAAHPKIVDWLCQQGGVKYGAPDRSKSKALN